MEGKHLIGGLLIAFAEITMLANNLRSDGPIKKSEIQYAQMSASRNVLLTDYHNEACIKNLIALVYGNSRSKLLGMKDGPFKGVNTSLVDRIRVKSASVVFR